MNEQDQKKLNGLLAESERFRSKLVSRMESLDKKNINCKNCSGVCCTVQRNSMMVTPIEALDLYFYLDKNIVDKNALWKSINEAYLQFGLDREIYVKNKLMRKNYTCPLFKFESWGCPIDSNLKPLGCLGYNALSENVTAGENCASDVELLEAVDKDIRNDWDALNLKLKTLLNLDFDKTSIPKALLILREKLQ